MVYNIIMILVCLLSSMRLFRVGIERMFNLFLVIVIVWGLMISYLLKVGFQIAVRKIKNSFVNVKILPFDKVVVGVLQHCQQL